jgi:hypothetical protein
MGLKKTSVYINLLLLLFSIGIVAIIQFTVAIINNDKINNLNNFSALIISNENLSEQLNPVILAENNESSAFINKVKKTADLIDLNFSTLINGGQFNLSSIKLNIHSPEKNHLTLINKSFTTWVNYNKTLKQYLNFNHDQTDLLSKQFSELKFNTEAVKSFEFSEIEHYKKLSLIINIISILLFFLIITLIFLQYSKIVKSLKSIEKIIDEMTNYNTINSDSKLPDEFNDVYEKINNLNTKTNDITHFISQLVNEDYNVKFNNYNENDLIQSPLVKLRDKLKENIEINEKRLEEEKLRQWFADGHAKFNDILRDSSSSINLLAETSLKNIVKFFNAAQGGFFILKEDGKQPYLELTSAFAYDRVKALNKRINLGESLVGMSALEKNTIWLNNIPDDYMEIESGLGEAPPSNLLIVPLKTEDYLLGVIEIASFNEFNKNEIDFLESIARNIATTLETTKITDKTSVLLEESQKKSIELAERDSEMSEKIQQLRDAQIETKRSEFEMTGLISAVDKLLYKIEISVRGKIISANQLFINDIKTRTEELKNMSLSDFISSEQKSIIEKILNDPKNKKSTQHQITFISKNNEEIKVNALFSPVHNEQELLSKIIVLADNVSKIEELTHKNTNLIKETEEKQKQIEEFNLIIQTNLNDYKNQFKEAESKIKKYKDKEELIKEQFESESDQKYTRWLNSFKS